MPISKDLFLSILSMDSYNRGYDAGMNDGGAGDTDGLGRVGSQIGNAAVVNDANSPAARSTGLYAVAYDTPYGTVTSYRGTDNLALYGDEASVSDVYGGGLSPHPFRPDNRGQRLTARGARQRRFRAAVRSGWNQIIVSRQCLDRGR